MPMTDARFEQFKVRFDDILLNEGQSLDLVGRCAVYRDEYTKPCAMQNQLLRFRAEDYFEDWYGPEAIRWLEQFRKKTNDELELLATVDMAAEELRAAGQNVQVDSVKDVIRNHPEWRAKLDRPVFSDGRIHSAIETSRQLFGSGGVAPGD